MVAMVVPAVRPLMWTDSVALAVAAGIPDCWGGVSAEQAARAVRAAKPASEAMVAGAAAQAQSPRSQPAVREESGGAVVWPVARAATAVAPALSSAMVESEHPGVVRRSPVVTGGTAVMVAAPDCYR